MNFKRHKVSNRMKKAADILFSEKMLPPGIQKVASKIFKRSIHKSFCDAEIYIKLNHPDIYSAQLQARQDGGLGGEYQWRRLFEIEHVCKLFNIKKVIELGGGTSTVMFAKILPNDGKVISYEESDYWSQRMAESSPQHLLHKIERVVRPRETFNVEPDVLASRYASKRLEDCDLIYIDGPTDWIEEKGSIPGVKDAAGHIPVVDVEDFIKNGHKPKIVMVDRKRVTVSRLISSLSKDYDLVLRSELVACYSPKIHFTNYHTIFMKKEKK